MTGKLYGIGTGPGDPELMTLKALRIIKNCDVIAVPDSDPDKCIAYTTAKHAVPEIIEKRLLCVPFMMSGTLEKRMQCRIENAETIARVLDSGSDTAFLTIGDPAIYTTFGYVAEILMKRGYETEFINGVPSFCAAAARMNKMLCIGTEGLEIIPGAAEPEKKTRVYMKNERNLEQLLAELRSEGADAQIVERCCLDGERVFSSISDLPDDIGYFNIIIVNEKES